MAKGSKGIKNIIEQHTPILHKITKNNQFIIFNCKIKFVKTLIIIIKKTIFYFKNKKFNYILTFLDLKK